MNRELFLLLISDFLEEDLTPELLEEFEELLVTDDCCCHYVATLRRTVELCRQMEGRLPPVSLHTETMELIFRTPQNTPPPHKKRNL